MEKQLVAVTFSTCFELFYANAVVSDGIFLFFLFLMIMCNIDTF